MIKNTCITVLGVLVLSACSQSEPEELGGVVDLIFADVDNPASPGCAVGIQKGGKTLFTKGYGMADIKSARPNGPDTHFNIASMTKQFTVLSIRALQTRGKLSVQDDIRDYIPEMPKTDTVIKISNLIHHTSGLMDYTNYLYLAGMRKYEGLEREFALEITTGDFPLVSPVGSRWAYNNGAYVLLAEIVRRVSGEDFEIFARREILGSVDMKASYFRSKNDPDFGPAATPYDITENGPVVSGGSVEYSGDGGLVTTVNDFLKYTAEIHKGESLWNEPNRLFMTTSGKLTGPEVYPDTGTLDTNYGGAIGLRRSHDRQLYRHSGSIDGFNSLFAVYPDDKLAFVAFCNFSGAELYERFSRLEDFFFGVSAARDGKKQAAPKEVNNTPLPKSLIASLEGTFRSEKLNATYEIEPLVDGLVVTLTSPYTKTPIRTEYPHAALRHGAAQKYFIVLKDAEIETLREPGNKLDKFLLHSPALPPFEFERVK